MAKFQLEKLSKEEQEKLLRKFFTAIVSLSSYQEVANFFKDLLNKQETIMLARRLKAAQLIEEGLTFDEVAIKMGMSKTTIAKISYWYKYGFGGYQIALRRLNKVEDREESRKIRKVKGEEPFTFAWIQKRYGAITPDDIKELAAGFEDLVNKIKKKRSLYKKR